MLEKVRRAPGLIKVESVVQAEPLGLGHAVSCVEPSLDDDEDAVAVLLPDDLVLPTGVLETMSKVRAKRGGGSVLCAIEVPADEISAYGVFDVEVVPDAVNPNVLRVKGMVEKPKAEDAPVAVRGGGSVRVGPRDLRRPAPSRTWRRRRDPADRRDRPADRRGGIPFTWWCTAVLDTTWEIPAAT